jgi:hypothetical protein
MCDTRERSQESPTAARPPWWSLYARASLMLTALLSVQIVVRDGTELTVLECALVVTGFVTLAQWARRNRSALDRLEWCDCASSRVSMRVIPSRCVQSANVEEEEHLPARDVEPAVADLVAR